MAKNDERILQLQAKIDTKRTELAGQSARFAPITTCTLDLHGVRINLHQMNETGLKLIACELQALLTAAHDLNFTAEDVVISGYNISAWMSDVTARLQSLKVKGEQDKLKQLEAKLKTLLSADKKTELELDEIESML